jgi:hypothetical protein
MVLLGLITLGCGAHSDSGTVSPPVDAGAIADLGAPPLCTPGAQVACACPGGTASVQVCAANGTLGTCACPDAGAAVDVGVDAGVAPCLYNTECRGLNYCADGCCRAPGSAGCFAPLAECAADADCGAGRLCVRGACRAGCDGPNGDVICGNAAEATHGYATYCVMGSDGRAYCGSQGEARARPQCTGSANCPSGQHCFDAICR